MTSWQPAYIALGSNENGPRQQVHRALAALASMPCTRVILRSRDYLTAPFGPVVQQSFVNAVAGLLTQLAPLELLHELRRIEQSQGRVRSVRWGPRTIDLDLLVHGCERIATEELTVPHPGIAERAFVLYPLADIAPELDIPGVGRVADLRARVGGDGIEVLAP